MWPQRMLHAPSRRQHAATLPACSPSGTTTTPSILLLYEQAHAACFHATQRNATCRLPPRHSKCWPPGGAPEKPRASHKCRGGASQPLECLLLGQRGLALLHPLRLLDRRQRAVRRRALLLGVAVAVLLPAVDCVRAAACRQRHGPAQRTVGVMRCTNIPCMKHTTLAE